ncbi:hypothetical protein NL676_006580 [Syzygium grande]|nr:hypothetical protein NL676_006580 [Syzygium grande]
MRKREGRGELAGKIPQRKKKKKKKKKDENNIRRRKVAEENEGKAVEPGTGIDRLDRYRSGRSDPNRIVDGVDLWAWSLGADLAGFLGPLG